MAIITPDISAFYPGYGQPQEPNQPTDPSQIAQLVKQMAGTGEEAMLAELVRQGMTKGLSQGDGGIGQLDGRLNYSGPVAGYAGPLRESDKPGMVVPMMSPGEARDAEIQQSFRNENPQLQKALDALGMLPKGTSDAVEAGIANRLSPGLIAPKEGKQPSLQERALLDLTRRKAGNDSTDLVLKGLSDDELKVLAGIEGKPKDPTNAKPPRTPTKSDRDFLKATYDSVYKNTKGAHDAKRKAGMAAANQAAGVRGFAAELNEGFFSDSVDAVAAPTTQALGPDGWIVLPGGGRMRPMGK